MIVRQANDADAGAMAEILNEIIGIGGTTALEGVVCDADLKDWMARNADRASWVVAEDADGRIMGFQWFEPNPKLPPEAADIATFARASSAGRGIGTAMFEMTKDRARVLGYGWINASIRSDNRSGLTYYAKMGFQDYGSDPTVALSDGTVTGKTYKRFDL